MLTVSMSQPMSYSRGMSPSQTHSSYYSNAANLSNSVPGFQQSDINSLHFTGQQSDKHLGSPVPPRIPSTYPIQNSGRGNSIGNNDYSTTSQNKPTSQTSALSAAKAMSSFNHEGLNFPLKMLAECTPARGSQFVNQYGFSTDVHDITPQLDTRERIEHLSSDYLPAVSCNNFSTEKRTSTDGSDTPFPDPVSTKYAIQDMHQSNLCHDKVQENNEKNVGFAMKDSISGYRTQRYPYSELYQSGKMPQKNQSNICQSAGYNYQKLTPAETNSSLGASFLGIKPYRSFSSELNSPDLPLTDDIDMDFEFSLSTGIGEAGFDSFMAHDKNNSASNFQSNSGNCSMGNGQNRCHSGSTYIEGRINNNNSHNVNDNGINTSEDIGNATFLNNLKTESPDSMQNLSLSGFLSGDSSATDKKEIHNFKTESGKSACEFASPDNNMSAFMSLSSRNPSPGYLASSSEFWSDNRTHTPKSNNVTSSNCNDPSLLTNQNCPNNIQTSFFDDGNFQSLPPRSDVLNNGHLGHDSLQNENLEIGNFLMLDRKLSPAFSERNNTPYSENPYSMSYYVSSNDMEPVPDTYNHWHGNSSTTHVTANRKSWLSHDTNYISSYRDKFGVDSVSEMQASGTEDLMPNFVKSEPGFSTGIDHAAATDPNSICNNHISSTTPGINGSYDNNMDENNSKTPKDYDCDIDTVNRSLIPTTVNQTDRKRANSDAGRRALVAFLHQQSGIAESRPEGLSASMVNSAIQHILQNRPSVDSIPSTRESSHKTSRLARSFEAQLKDIGDDNNDDDDVVNDEGKNSKRRKSTRGSSEDVSTTTSTPSPLAPSSSSSPPIPLTATGSFPAAPATSRKKSASSNENNGNSNVSSSSKPEKRRPSVLPPCRVCYSKASGLHYGVVTCEACNGFFRRSLKRGAIYLCSKDKTCDVRGKKRGECSYCRYQKCLAVGMSKSAVKTGRYSDKTRLAYAMETESHNKANILLNDFSGADEVTSESLNIHDFDVTKTARIPDFNFFEKQYKQAGDNLEVQVKRKIRSITSLSEENVGFLWDDLTTLGDDNLEMIGTKSHVLEKWLRHYLTFVKSIPGFSLLSRNDQTTLTRAAWQGIWLLRSHREICFENKISAKTANQHSQYNEVKVMFGEECAVLTYRISGQLEELGVTENELVLVQMIYVTDPCRLGLEKPKQVRSLHWLMIQCLVRELKKNHPTDTGIFSQILSVLAELKTAPNMARLSSNGYTQNNSMTEEAPLLSEMTSSLHH